MGRGRSNLGSSGSRGMSSGGGRGMSSGRSHSRTTVIIGSGRHYHHGHGRPSKAGNIIGAIICLIFGFIMFAGVIGSIVDVNNYGSVQGTVVKNEQVNGWYYTTYEYTVKGQEYVERSNEGWEFPEEKQYATIYYDKDNPINIQETKPELGTGVVILALVGFAFTGVGVVLLIQGIKMKSGDNESGYSREIPSSSETSKPTHTTCSYCGNKYKIDLDKCPKCGGR